MIKIEDADKSFESCQECVHACDSTEICILRRCIHVFSELRECYKPKKELKPFAQPVDKGINVSINDCISRQAVYNVLDKMPVRGFKKDGETIHGLISLSQVNSAIINLPSAQPEPMSEPYMKAVWTWLLNYQIKAAELKGRYTPYEVLSWVVNDWRKEHEGSD